MYLFPGKYKKKKNLIKIYHITCFEKQSHLKNDTLIAINHK